MNARERRMEPAADFEERGRILLRIAWETVSEAARRPIRRDPLARRHAFLEQRGAVFVTLHRLLEGGSLQLRGCLGSLEATRPLLADLQANAGAVVHRDPRFPPVEGPELDDLELEVTELGDLRPLSVTDRQELLGRLRPGVDGLVVRWGGQQATFLPQVWEHGQVTPEEFLRALLEKAGLPADFWADDLALASYETRSWSSRWPGLPA